MQEKNISAGIVIRKFKGLSGAVVYAAELARLLPAHGFRTRILAQRGDPALARSCGAPLRTVPSLPFGWPGSRRVFSASAALLTGGLDLVHGQGDILTQDVLSLHNCVHAAHEAVHGAPLPADSGVGRMHSAQLSGRRFRRLIANSSLMKSEICGRFGIPPSLVTVVFPGVNHAKFAQRSPGLRQDLGLSPSDTVAGLVTSGDLRKRGAASFLRALAKARAKAPALKGLLVAGRSQAEELMPLARELGLGAALAVTPPSPAVERIYSALDFMAYPALYEEFGIVVAEAFASGLPVILRCGRVGAAEALTPRLREEFGFSDEDQLAEKMSSLALSPERRAALGAEARTCAEKLTWDAAAAAVAGVYGEVLAEKQRKAP